MKNIKKYLVKGLNYIVFSAFLLNCSNSDGNQLPEFIDTLSLDQNIELFVKKLRNPKEPGPGIAIVVKEENNILYKKSFGLANMATNTAITDHSSFYLASVSKQFTAMAIMMLENEKKIQFSDNITQYFPEAPDDWETITIHHLLTHQSGIPDYLNELGYGFEGIKNAQVLEHVIENGNLNFEPGAQFSYSNTGYVLLALLIERVTGQSIASFLEDNIFRQIGMKNTFVFVELDDKTNEVVRGYSPNGQLNDYHLLTVGDGGIYSSASDLLLWSYSFINETLIPNEQLSTVSLNHVLVDTNFSYGYGWGIGKVKDFSLFTHSGGLGGFRTKILIVPDKRFTIIILSNGSYGESIERLTEQILSYGASSWE